MYSAKKVLHQHQDAQQSKEEQQFDQMQEIQGIFIIISFFEYCVTNWYV